jgi:hypothetical protein
MVVKYSYKLKNFLHSKELGPIGFIVIVMTEDHFYEVDVPAEIFPPEVMAYMRFRLTLTPRMEVTNLPPYVQNGLRRPLAEYLDIWLEENNDGDSCDGEDFNS